MTTEPVCHYVKMEPEELVETDQKKGLSDCTFNVMAHMVLPFYRGIWARLKRYDQLDILAALYRGDREKAHNLLDFCDRELLLIYRVIRVTGVPDMVSKLLQSITEIADRGGFSCLEEAIMTLEGEHGETEVAMDFYRGLVEAELLMHWKIGEFNDPEFDQIQVLADAFAPLAGGNADGATWLAKMITIISHDQLDLVIAILSYWQLFDQIQQLERLVLADYRLNQVARVEDTIVEDTTVETK